MDTKWLIEPILNHYADFSGRATRQQFWMFHLYVFASYVALLILSFISGVHQLPLLGMLAIVVPSVAINTRRLHDINKTGWWQLLSIIPLIGPIVLLVWACTKGDMESNQYGAPVGQAGPMSDMTPTTPSMMADVPATPIVTDAEIVSSNEGKMM